MAWQQARVGVREDDSQLHISDLDSGEVIARHAVCTGKGQIIKNTHHYRDHAQRLATLEAEIHNQIGQDIGDRLCQQLKRSEPKVYKDQLVAVRNLLRRYAPVKPELMATLAERPGMTAIRLRDYLEASRAAFERDRLPEPLPVSSETLDLSAYGRIGHSSGQEATHEFA